MNSYLNNPSATAEAIDNDGWFHTGDIGFIHPSGNVKITDRLKEVIKVKGFQVAPAELEAYLCGHEAVADAGVTAIYNEDEATELPLAYIVPKNTKLLESSAKAGKACPETVNFVSEVMKYIESKVVDYKFVRGGVIVTDAIPKSL
jgi:long-subunit acyl-CoA synthetase (AMP-forming)